MLAALRQRHRIKTADASDGGIQFWNNADLGRIVVHWMRHDAKPQGEIATKLLGWHQPRRVPGRRSPRPLQGRCKAYDLRHAWAIRARETTTWSTALKAQAMGHSEAVHARRYLVEERAEHRRQGLLQLVAHDEGRTNASASATASGTEAISPEIIALARQLAALKG
jgi:hypothetical protein